ncbi:MAG: hypothetical protein GF333_03025 [Candidatus Omnitrophica bacterium]|nr:hypothetical protein [Candidatus Omnitrophota bacterium]
MSSSEVSHKKNHYIVLLLAVVPGCAHLYLGRIRKALGLWVIDTGIILTVIFSDSYLMKLIMVNIYLFTFLPAGLETYSLARGKRSVVDTDSRWYTVTLLLTTGFSALPLLWQNRKFSRRAKILWTIAVPLLAGLFFFFLVTYWEMIEQFLRRIFP